MGKLIWHAYDPLPKSLDDVIRKNRKLVELRLSSIKEIDAVHIEIQPGIKVKEVIDDWRLISFRHRLTGLNKVLLLGEERKLGALRITSPIVLLDLPHNTAVTKSGSVYRLGSRGEGEP